MAPPRRRQVGRLRPPTRPPDHRDLIAHLDGAWYGGTLEKATWIPSDEADVFRLSFRGRANRIVKVERAGHSVVHKEQRAFPALREQGFTEFPEVEHTQDDLPHATAVFMVMPESPSVPLAELWAQRSPALWAVERTGDFLRRLRDVEWSTVPAATTPAEASRLHHRWFRRWFDPVLRAPWLADRHEATLHRILDALATMPTGFGGWQFGQVLTDGRSFTAIDWVNLGAYWPLKDVAGTIASLPAYGDDAPQELEPVLLDAYTGGSGLSPDAARELAVWRATWDAFYAASLLRDDEVTWCVHFMDRASDHLAG